MPSENTASSRRFTLTPIPDPIPCVSSTCDSLEHMTRHAERKLMLAYGTPARRPLCAGELRAGSNPGVPIRGVG